MSVILKDFPPLPFPHIGNVLLNRLMMVKFGTLQLAAQQGGEVRECILICTECGFCTVGRSWVYYFEKSTVSLVGIVKGKEGGLCRESMETMVKTQEPAFSNPEPKNFHATHTHTSRL